MPLIEGFLELYYAENTGMAFSLFSSSPVFLLVTVSIINACILFYIIKEKEYTIAMAFLLSGAASNLFDRLAFGFVTDMINFTFIDFAVFNLADVFINIGVYLLVLKNVFMKESANDQSL